MTVDLSRITLGLTRKYDRPLRLNARNLNAGLICSKAAVVNEVIVAGLVQV